MSLYLGIDFGTSTDYITRWNEEKGEVEEVTAIGKYGSRTVFPNVIYYEGPDNFIVGDVALRKGIVDPENCVLAVKRRIEEKGFHQYVPNVGRELTSKEISRDIFHYIKTKVETAYGDTAVDGCIVSVPFAFQHREREIIKSAAEEAGLPVLGLIEEPVAAALSFGLAHQLDTGAREKILVFDLGGGTFDVTIFDFWKISASQFNLEVLSTDGAKDLGGLDIDNLIMDKMQEQLERTYPEYQLSSLAPRVRAKDLIELRKESVQLKENLSESDEEDIFFHSENNEDVFLDETVALKQFNQWLAGSGFLADIENVLDSSLLNANLSKEDIDRIILVGGTSNVPVIQQLVQKFFNKEPEKLEEPDKMVGTGAGIYCGFCLHHSVTYKIITRVSQSIGIKKKGKFTVLIEKNTPYGKASAITYLHVKRKDRDKHLDIYQGVALHPDKVGTLFLPASILQRVSEEYIGVQLNTDSNGMIFYTLYDVKNNQPIELESGRIEEV